MLEPIICLNEFINWVMHYRQVKLSQRLSAKEKEDCQWAYWILLMILFVLYIIVS